VVVVPFGGVSARPVHLPDSRGRSSRRVGTASRVLADIFAKRP